MQDTTATRTQTRVGPGWIETTTTGNASPVAPALLRVRQAASYLSIHPYSLYRLVRVGKIPHVRLGNGIRIRRADLDVYLAARTTRTWSRVDRRGRPPRTPAA